VLGPAQRYRTLGTTCLVLGLLEVLYCVQRLLSQLFRGSIVDAQRSMIPGVPGGPNTQAIMDAAREMMDRIALWESLRTIPFLVATGFLLWIALRLREGEARALFAARRWVLGAFAAIAVGVVIQVVWTMPAMAEYQRKIMGSILPIAGGDAASSVDVKEIVESIGALSVVLGVVGGTLVLSAWPIVLYVWSGRLIRETLRPAAR
jgi:hypothetical protein